MSDKPAASSADNAAKEFAGGKYESAAQKASSAAATSKPLPEQNAAFRMMGMLSLRSYSTVRLVLIAAQAFHASAYPHATG